MRIPRIEKIFFCLPLRSGVVLLVFLNLLVAAAAFCVFGYLDFVKVLILLFTGEMKTVMQHGTRSKVHFNLVIPLVLVFALAELVMTVFALVAVLREKLKLTEAYLYYSTMLTVFVVCFRILDMYYVSFVVDLSTTTLFLLFKTYYLISVRSLVRTPHNTMPTTIEMADKL